MYNNVYQEYINNMIGQSSRNAINFEENTYNNFEQMEYFQNENIHSDLEQFYPDLYRLIYPMVKTACMRNTKPLTKECIDEMVKDIYSNFVAEDEATVLNINLTNDVRSKATTENKSSSKTITNTKLDSKDSMETRNIDRRPNNFVLNDLIRILLIRELLGRPGNVFPRPLARPPFPNPGRPSFRNDINFTMQDNSIYENSINMYSNFN